MFDFQVQSAEKYNITVEKSLILNFNFNSFSGTRDILDQKYWLNKQVNYIILLNNYLNKYLHHNLGFKWVKIAIELALSYRSHR